MKLILLVFCTAMLFANCSGPNNPKKPVENDNKSPKSESSIYENKPSAADDDEILHFYFTPSVDDKIVMQNGQKLIDFLEKETNRKFEIHVTKNYDDMIAAFGNGKADIAIMNSLSYIKAREQFGVSAKLRAVRFGKSIYFGQIVTNAASGINSIEDLEGKTIAYTDRSSTSGYFFPQSILKKAGVKPGKVIFAGKHDTVVKMVYEGLVEAGATFYSEPTSTGIIRDARSRIMDKYPDVEEKVKILAITNPIPNDPVVFRKDIPNAVSYDISLGLIKYLSTEEGKKVLTEMYSTEGFVRCSDSDYDELRDAVAN